MKSNRKICLLILLILLLFNTEITTAQIVQEINYRIDLDINKIINDGPNVIYGSVEKLLNEAGNKQAFSVKPMQYGFSIDDPIYIDEKSVLKWAWKKNTGKIIVLQIGIINPETNEMRYFGYGSGSSSESLSRDPTVEIFVDDKLPDQWIEITRNIGKDIKNILKWKSAKVIGIYLSPWDGDVGLFSDLTLSNCMKANVMDENKKNEINENSKIGKGSYLPPMLKSSDEKRDLLYDYHFEELAPGRNSASNEWSAFGWPAKDAFNAIGRDMRVRYPAFDLVFSLYDGYEEIKPDSLDSFRLGLIENDLPAIWGSWKYDDIQYKVSVMSVPFDDNSAYDLYKIEIVNTSQSVKNSKLSASVDGPPGMQIKNNKLTGFGDSVFMITDKFESDDIITKDWGLCDKRAKSYQTGGGPGKTEGAVSSTRVGMDGLPVKYRFKSEAGKKYTVCLVSSPHISPILGYPEKSGDLIFIYDVEGSKSQNIDWFDYISKKSQPLCAIMKDASDTNNDGYIDISISNSPESKLKHTRLSVIYVFPNDIDLSDYEKIYSGELNDQAIWHIDVGVTPECDWNNQNYDMSDVGLCRLRQFYGGELKPGESGTYWLKVPPIYRREPVSMGNYSHAFSTILPGEAIPPFDGTDLKKLVKLNPNNEWKKVIDFWKTFYDKAVKIKTPDSILGDIYRSRLGTRYIHDVKIKDNVWFNTSSPWFYYDFAYRDQAYVVFAYDLAGLHDLSERLLDVYCMDSKDVPLGPISFGGVPLQLGMDPDGLWITRPGQYDTQGQNIWCMAQHYKLSGDRKWLEEKAYPFIKRGAMWIVNSRHKHMLEIKNQEDPRYGLIQPGAMEVGAISKGMHMYYMDAWAILGLNEASDVARSLGLLDDSELFIKEANELKRYLIKSMKQTFKRDSLYQGYFWYGVEEQGDGMYGMWAHTPLVWPTKAVDPHDPMLVATWRKLERMSNQWGGGMLSENEGSCWPYIGVDWAISYILRGEPEKTLDYFCGFTDTAGLTLSWGEGYVNQPNLASGDQPHFWADAQWLNLYRHLFALEDGSVLYLTPASLRRWNNSKDGVLIENLPTHFGDLSLDIKSINNHYIKYNFTIESKGDQSVTDFDKIVINARIPNGKFIKSIKIDNEKYQNYFGESVIIPDPKRGKKYELLIEY